MIRRASLLAVALSAATAGLASAQLARPRVAAPDAPKVLVVHFVRDSQDSALSLVVADGVRDRLRSTHLDKFNTIQRRDLNTVLTESGFQADVPLEPAQVRQVTRFMNAKFVLEGSMIRRAGDSILVVARLAEATGTTPQAATVSLTAPAGRIGTATGGELANRLVDGYRSFDEVAECRRLKDAGQLDRAQAKADQALRQYPSNAGAWLCIAEIREAQNAPADSVVSALRNAYDRDTLATAVMRRLATKYEQKGDTTNLLDMLKRILTIDFRDNDLRIATARLMVQMGQPDSAVRIVNQGLRENPASVELLGVKAIAMGAGRHWDSAMAALQLVSEIDTSKVDSLFLFRITNYAQQIPDTTRWLQWVEKATQKFPTQYNYWYTLASMRMLRGDSTGAMAAAEGLLRVLPADARTSQEASLRGLYARGHYIIAMLQNGRGMVDSALAHAELAEAADTTMRSSLAVVYLIAGGKMRVDSNYAKAIELLQKAKDWAGTNQRLIVPAAFQLGISQFLLAVKTDSAAQAGRDCDLARRVDTLMAQAEQNIIAGVAVDRNLANQFLSQYIPAYKQRASTMQRQYCRGDD